MHESWCAHRPKWWSSKNLHPYLRDRRGLIRPNVMHPLRSIDPHLIQERFDFIVTGPSLHRSGASTPSLASSSSSRPLNSSSSIHHERGWRRLCRPLRASRVTKWHPAPPAEPIPHHISSGVLSTKVHFTIHSSCLTTQGDHSQQDLFSRRGLVDRSRAPASDREIVRSTRRRRHLRRRIDNRSLALQGESSA